MGRKRRHMSLSVWLNGRKVGQYQRQSSGALSFTYDPSWLTWENRFPISLSLPLRADRYIGDVVSAVFENLLPDEDIVRGRIAERVGAHSQDSFGLLAEIGRDCIGALQFLSEDDEAGPPTIPEGRQLNEAEIAYMLRNLESTPLGINAEKDFRISVAGAQEKTALLRYQNHWHEPHGTTPTTHIIKPQIGKLVNGVDLSQSVENEYICLQILKAFELEVAKAEIENFEDQRALVVERFDRLWTTDNRLLRLPQEDCCQALSIPPSRKYQNEGGPDTASIMNLLKQSDEPNIDRANFFKANILFWLMGATDGHAKNFSIALRPGGRFRMTPFYDVISAQPNFDANQIGQTAFKLAMSWGNSRHYQIRKITRKHILETGLKSGLSEGVTAEIIDNILQQIDTALMKVESEIQPDFPINIFSSIASGIRKRSQRLHDKI